jgi:choline dehydrogenase-like flavoprotein
MKQQHRAIVIGTGAGGGPAAWRLARAWGDEVAILEAGAHLKAKDFDQLERNMVPKLYARGGTQGTEDGSLSVLQGEAVGGSTLVNDGLCFRPPPEIVERWAAYGVDLDLARLNALADEVEARMQVRTIPRELINRGNYLVGLGASRLGWKGERLRHNSPGCVECGFRHLGCAYDAKLSTNLSFIPAALEAGAVLYDKTRVSHLQREAGRWVVHTDKGEHTADHVVLCAGIVQTPAILLRSGIAAGEGVQVHQQAVAWGDFDERVDGYAGIPMSYGVMEFSDVYGNTGPGFLIEGVGVQALAFSVQPLAMAEAHEEVLRRYRHLAGALSLVRSKARGRITLGAGGRPSIEYPLIEADVVRQQEFYRRASELFFAAGATRVRLAHRSTGWLEAPPGEVPMAPGLAYLYSAHPFGGANRGATTDGEGRVKGQVGLWVLDASGFPEALGVNPQVTIAALALEGVDRVVAGG